ncbi:hypothetical protein D3870_14645 [Noviherbaspirillum cavernae]|uniref:Uncharacterized protein n=1 Tax=Noviherbaspirillum cavernae TaxID=2320862 RepID=A0A418X3N9_9BURK|nr:hypothetical protein [Noviherbaspirillum cavernae]RJG07070.1 hypothetical protein D3870_14645 [Noviherbaspirillum cavernae]
MWSRRFLILLLSAAVTLPAWAFERPFPQNARRGTMTPAPYPAIVLDGAKRILSPGARIWNQENLTETPASLRGSDMAVNYTENAQGEIDRVWILTQEEASRPPAKSKDNLQQ